jgi:hypothetical protein
MVYFFRLPESIKKAKDRVKRKGAFFSLTLSFACPIVLPSKKERFNLPEYLPSQGENNMVKRLFVFTVLFTLLKFMTTGLMAMETSALKVEGGMIKGVPFGQDEVGRAYYGIPNAAPPLGALRWRLPQAVEPPPCVQTITGSLSLSDLARPGAWHHEA